MLAGAPEGERELPDERLLLARYLRLGERFLDEVRGPFALALTDPEAGRALVARDGMGNRLASYVLRGDLFVASVSQGLDAADTATPLLTFPGVSADLDSFRLAEFFAFDEVHGAASFFRDVRQVLPGEMLLVQGDAVRYRLLPRPSLALRVEPASWEEAVERCSELLAAAVAHATRGHRRVAVWLSGGLDSTPIAALTAKLLPAVEATPSVVGISWRVAAPEGDERTYVEEAGRHGGFPIAWVDCEDALPLSDLAHWPVHPASPEQTAYRWFHERSHARARALGASLVLTGFSGDPLYVDARRWFWTLALAEGPGSAIDRLRAAGRRDGWPTTLRTQVVGALLPKARRLRRPVTDWLTVGARQLLAPARPWPSDLHLARRPRQAERVLSLVDAHGEHLETWYAARHGLAVATPLRDFDLAQFLLAVPDHYLQQGTESRPILRAAIRGLVPASVHQRSGKASFRDVFVRGFAAGRLAWAGRLLRDADALWPAYVEATAVERWLAGHFRDDWERVGLLQCIFAELWRFTRAGGELRSLTRT